MPKLILSAQDIIKYLKTKNYFIISQIGSHIKLKNETINKTIIVPNHNPIAQGTLNNIINILLDQTGIDKQTIKKELEEL
ncbi:MAG: hypothetical protein COT14_02765 [Candidatus Diapherotrites archaeon CG08_land_8_20_14_0_20_30_16]|nr:MAG: hypothetical protein COT14_02765 [Candidatus Diapherotrites archaeon CG08_land_8_20_14_0_20_30_16]